MTERAIKIQAVFPLNVYLCPLLFQLQAISSSQSVRDSQGTYYLSDAGERHCYSWAASFVEGRKGKIVHSCASCDFQLVSYLCARIPFFPYFFLTSCFFSSFCFFLQAVFSCVFYFASVSLFSGFLMIG